MWKNILGHKRQIDQLMKMAKKQTLPNALLFTGPHGVGKKLVAKAFSATLLCREKNGPCGSCSQCLKTAGEQHPDLFIVVPEKERIKIEQIREVMQKLQFHPLEGDVKLAIIDDADRMTEGASNSLLKILEEPPSATHFILISSFPQSLLATIRSRCQTIPFSPLPAELIAQSLQEHTGRSQEEAKQIALLSQGSLAAAQQLEPEFIATTLERFQVLEAKASAADIIATSEEWSRAGEATPLLLDILSSWYRDQLIFATTGDTGFLIHQGIPTRSISVKRVETSIKALLDARSLLETTANKQLLFEQLLFSLTSPTKETADARRS